MKPTKVNLSFRGVLYQEDDMWIAHCLETDIVAEGKTQQEAVKNILDLSLFQVETALEDGDLKSIFRPAPPDVMHMYALASKMATPRPRSKRATAVEQQFELRELALV